MGRTFDAARGLGLDPVWSWPGNENGEADALREHGGWCDAMARVLAHRGIDASEAEGLEAEGPEALAAARAALGRFEEAEALAAMLRADPAGSALLCDYDVDGAVAGAILCDALRLQEGGGRWKPAVGVPDRNSEGFGPNDRVVGRLAARGARCVATLDCGSAAARVLDRWRGEGLRTAVLDHHPVPMAQRPTGALLANPHLRSDGAGALGALCTGALALEVAVAMHPAGRNEAVERSRGRWLVLAGLATTCDVMDVGPGPAGAYNRALVKESRRRFAEGGVGLAALAATGRTRVDPRHPDRDAYGWRLGPMLNAGSRMGESHRAVSCLATDDPAKGREHAEQLDSLNERRKEQTAGAKDRLEALLCERPALPPCVAVLAPWAEPGLAGLLAGHVVRVTGRAAVVVGRRQGTDQWSGSGRGRPGLDVGQLVEDAVSAGRAAHGGGHPMACGVGASSRLQADALVRWIEEESAQRWPGWRPTVPIDAELHHLDCTSEALVTLEEDVERLSPWGNGMEVPMLGVRRALVVRDRLYRDRAARHLFGVLMVEGQPLGFRWFHPPANWPMRLGLGTADGRTILHPRNESRLGGQGTAQVAGRIGVSPAWGGRPAEVVLMVEQARPVVGRRR